MSIPEPTTFNGDDTRELSGDPKTVANLFWKAFEFARRHHTLDEFFAIYECKPFFADLVCQAHAKLQAEASRKGAA